MGFGVLSDVNSTTLSILDLWIKKSHKPHKRVGKTCNKAKGLIGRKLLTWIILKVLSVLLFFDEILGMPPLAIKIK